MKTKKTYLKPKFFVERDVTVSTTICDGTTPDFETGDLPTGEGGDDDDPVTGGSANFRSFDDEGNSMFNASLW